MSGIKGPIVVIVSHFRLRPMLIDPTKINLPSSTIPTGPPESPPCNWELGQIFKIYFL